LCGEAAGHGAESCHPDLENSIVAVGITAYVGAYPLFERRRRDRGPDDRRIHYHFPVDLADFVGLDQRVASSCCQLPSACNG
jgi:hypothetical protein